MMISEFLTNSRRFEGYDLPEMDALTEPEALDEAALIDMRFNAVDSSAWLLFDCRGALQVRAGNTAIVVLKSIRTLEWKCSQPKPRAWRYVLGWESASHGSVLQVKFFADDTGEFRATCLAGEFHVGDIPGGDEAPPDFVSATDEEVREGLAQWSSPFTPIRASFLDLAAG